MKTRRKPRRGMASLPLMRGIPIGATAGLLIGAAAGNPGIGAAIGVPAGLGVGLVATVIWEQLRR
ncbi:hypothetical protein LQ938_05940 [Microbacterium sp. cx-55]|uniref:hypothetical protein n=1 Tax=unclassified Microbacterium TaxID=2609290 RepID=UPI001CC03C66|nr:MULTISPECIES: hypothetical protein [unclassified Microbacterium]MBZ4486717.1 hypothetical protein [Microbacterium sp. cx-55]MCC4907684.1 hypothetical protein [Microbacterium sp. cx-59]UGB36323.1 hypothetical protein LQ938_05940 [Microbacterium sp. cx-55]